MGNKVVERPRRDETGGPRSSEVMNALLLAEPPVAHLWEQMNGEERMINWVTRTQRFWVMRWKRWRSAVGWLHVPTTGAELLHNSTRFPFSRSWHYWKVTLLFCKNRPAFSSSWEASLEKKIWTQDLFFVYSFLHIFCMKSWYISTSPQFIIDDMKHILYFI